jgi:hypothetical protein
MKKKLVDSNGMTDHYLAELEDNETEFPSNNEIIKFCDKYAQGGTVRISGKVAFVNVWID